MVTLKPHLLQPKTVYSDLTVGIGPFSEFSIFRLNYVGYVNVSRVLGTFFGSQFIQKIDVLRQFCVSLSCHRNMMI